MAAENGPSAGEYIVHHLTHLQNTKAKAVVDFSVFNIDSLFFSTTRGVLTNDATLTDLLSLVSPAEDYSGEPADRALRVISSVEPFSRGPAFGHLAMIGFNGSLSLTLNKDVVVNNSHELRYATGLPVYGDTKPDIWYDELVKKAEAALRIIGDDSEISTSLTA